MSSNNRFYLASAPIWRSLVHLCIPMIAGFSVGVVYNIINAGFIGSLHSTPLLAALTFSLPVFALIMAVGGVFGVGGGTFITRLLGSQEDGKTDAAASALRIKQVSSFTMWGAIAAGAIVGVLGLIFATPIADRGRRVRCSTGPDGHLHRDDVRLRPDLRRRVRPRTGGARRGCGHGIHDGSHRLDDRQPGLRRAVHPHPALGRRSARASRWASRTS